MQQVVGVEEVQIEDQKEKWIYEGTMITWVHCWIEVVKIIASVGIERRRIVIMEGEMMMDIVEEGEGEKGMIPLVEGKERGIHHLPELEAGVEDGVIPTACQEEEGREEVIDMIGMIDIMIVMIIEVVAAAGRMADEEEVRVRTIEEETTIGNGRIIMKEGITVLHML